MTSKDPLVSVIIPFVRCDTFLLEAANSVFNQEYINLEILFLDNQPHRNSETPTFLDKRARIINCRSSKSLSEVLNKGIRLCTGEFVARMDADDISDKTRIRKQVDFLRLNKDVGLVGTGILTFGEHGIKGQLLLQPASHQEIIKKLPWNNPFFHPTVMYRKTNVIDIKGPYRTFFRRSQDYELWTRLVPKIKTGNIAEALLSYRIHNEQSGRQIPHESLFYYRLAQFKFSVNYRKDPNFGFGCKVIAVNLKNLITELTKFALSLSKAKIKSLRIIIY